MKKLVSMMLAVLLACLLPLAGMAEKTGLPDLTGRWSDPAFDRANIEIMRDFEAWSGDLMGEEASGQRRENRTSGGAWEGSFHADGRRNAEMGGFLSACGRGNEAYPRYGSGAFSAGTG